MKRVLFWIIILSISLICHAQEQIQVVENISFSYMYMEFQGPVFSSIYSNIGIFIQEGQKQDLLSKVTSSLFLINYNSNLIVENADSVWGLCYRIPENISVKVPLKKAIYKYDNVIKMNILGPYEIAERAYNEIVPFIDENSMEVIGPPIQIWHDDPALVHPDSCRTEFIIPVRKQK